MDISFDSSYWIELFNGNLLEVILRLFADGGWVIFIVIGLIFLARIWRWWRRNLYRKNKTFKIIALDIPAPDEEDSTVKTVENIFAQISSIPKTGSKWDTWWRGLHALPISFEIVSIEGFIQFVVRADKLMMKLIESAILAQYPNAEISEIEDYTDAVTVEDFNQHKHNIWGAEYTLAKEDFYPIRTYQYFEHQFAKKFADPLTSVFEAMNDLKKGEQMWFQVELLPTGGTGWQEKGLEKIKELIGNNSKKDGFKSLILNEVNMAVQETGKQGLGDLRVEQSAEKPKEGDKNQISLVPPDKEPLVSAIQSKIARPGLSARLRIIYIAKPEVFSEARSFAEFQGILKQFENMPFNGFIMDKGLYTCVDYFQRWREPARKRTLLYRAKSRAFYLFDKGSVLNAEELATIWHFPTNKERYHAVSDVSSRKVKASHRVPTREHADGDDITILGETSFRNERTKFGIKDADRRRHIYIIGKTGMGKTTLLENMIISDIYKGKGVALIDPHGDLVERVMDYVPLSRVNDVLYFSPSDTEFPVAFNLFDADDVKHKYLISSAIVSIFKKIWADSWGPRLEYILRNSLLALLESPGNTLLGIPRMFVDKAYRNKVVRQVEDPVVKSFWEKEYARYQDKFQVEAVAPIQNKIGQFTTIATIRNIIGQTKSRINFRNAMDNKKILLFNLSKGLIGEDVSSLLGAMVLSKLQIAAMSRADVPEDEREDFFTYIDEFQNFSTESFADILSEARKYKLSLIMAHQYVGQLSETVRQAIFGNVGTSITFRVGAEDSEFLIPEYEPEFAATDLLALGQFEIALKLMIDSVTSRPFSARTLPPQALPVEGVREKIIRVSRERYAVPRKDIEEKLNKWLS